MRHSNQTGIFWQVEISAIPKPLSSYYLTGSDPGMLKQCIRNELPVPVSSGGCEERVLSHQHPAVYAQYMAGDVRSLVRREKSHGTGYIGG